MAGKLQESEQVLHPQLELLQPLAGPSLTPWTDHNPELCLSMMWLHPLTH